MTTDYISTETGCQYLRKYKIEDCAGILYDKGFNDGIETAISCIGTEVPSADVIPVEWIESQADSDKWNELIKRWNEYKEECK